jgi:hypothetical protein
MTSYMTKLRLLSGSLFLALLALAFFAAHSAFAEPDGAASSVPITTVVTVLGPKFTAPPPLGKDDVIVHLKDQRADITAWDSAQGEHGQLQLAILIDDGVNLGPRLSDLRHFIQTLPNSTSVGVFYASNGATLSVVPFTTDHEGAAAKTRITLGPGSTSTSIYLSTIDVMKKLEPLSGRREILLIGDGHDRLRGDLQSPDVDRVISSAQKTGIVIHTLYSSAGGRRRNSFRSNLAQGNLLKVSSGSGGQSFFQGLDTPISFTPFLDQLDMVLHNQYFLTFATERSTKKHGEFRNLKVTTEQRDTSITVQSQAFVPGL